MPPGKRIGSRLPPDQNQNRPLHVLQRNPPVGHAWTSRLLADVQKQVPLQRRTFKKLLDSGKIPDAQKKRYPTMTLWFIPSDNWSERVAQVVELVEKEAGLHSGFLGSKRAVQAMRQHGISCTEAELLSYAQFLQSSQKTPLREFGVVARATKSTPFVFSQKGMQNAANWIQQTRARIANKELVPLHQVFARTTRKYYALLRDDSIPKISFGQQLLLTAQQAKELKPVKTPKPVKRKLEIPTSYSTIGQTLKRLARQGTPSSKPGIKYWIKTRLQEQSNEISGLVYSTISPHPALLSPTATRSIMNWATSRHLAEKTRSLIKVSDLAQNLNVSLNRMQTLAKRSQVVLGKDAFVTPVMAAEIRAFLSSPTRGRITVPTNQKQNRSVAQIWINRIGISDATTQQRVREAINQHINSPITVFSQQILPQLFTELFDEGKVPALTEPKKARAAIRPRSRQTSRPAAVAPKPPQPIRQVPDWYTNLGPVRFKFLTAQLYLHRNLPSAESISEGKLAEQLGFGPHHMHHLISEGLLEETRPGEISIASIKKLFGI